MCAKLTCVAISLVGLTLSTPSASAADFSEQERLFDSEVSRSLECLKDVCRVAWPYDNLRPAALRAKWPEGTLFKPPETPVIHLSPGSPRYCAIVGQMAYWDARAYYGKKCLLDVGRLKVDDKLKTEILRLGGDLVEAKANYRRACAWAWPYENLRPLLKQPGMEPITILNPFLPVPTINLSRSSPTCKEIVAQLGHWDAEVCRCEKDLGDFLKQNNIPMPGAGGRNIRRRSERPPGFPRAAMRLRRSGNSGNFFRGEST